MKVVITLEALKLSKLENEKNSSIVVRLYDPTRYWPIVERPVTL